MAKNKIYVYHVLRKDFDHHTDRKGRMSLISTHTSEEGATKAAKAHLKRQVDNANSPTSAEVTETTKGADKLYYGFAHVFEDRRDNCTVEVKKMLLQEDGVPIGQAENAAAAPSAGAKQARTGVEGRPSKKRKSNAAETIELSDSD